jgi:hypothetical protein
MMGSGVAGEVEFGLGKCEEGGFDEEDDSQRPLESEQGGFIYRVFMTSSCAFARAWIL